MVERHSVARPSGGGEHALDGTFARTCPLCEAMCGLEITLDDGDVRRVRGDRADPYSRGFLCPKGASLGRVDADPGRLDGPLVRRDGDLRKATWDEAFAEVDRLVTSIIDHHGRDAMAVFFGNALAHNYAAGLYQPTLLRAIASRNVYSPATLDNMPHSVVAALMYGHAGTIPVPDIDRTDLFVVIGGNPVVSNGSVGSAPDYPGRLAALRARGGELVVVDPVRSATAELAHLHVRVRPGADAFLLAGVVNTLVEDDLVSVGSVPARLAGLDVVKASLRSFTPERVSARCGVDPATIRLLARKLAAARSAAVYCRLGTTLNRFSTLTSWLVQLINVVTGHIDRPGGMMFPESAAGSPTTRTQRRAAPTLELGRYRSRVRGAPEVLGELPAACLAEEMLVDGPGRVRGLLTVGGNPARSVPDSTSVEAGLSGLDALVCVDPYLNETSRLAHVVLPTPPLLSRGHFDLILTNYSLRNTVKYSAPLVSVPATGMEEWRILLRLSAVFAGQGPDADVDKMAEAIANKLIDGISRESGIAAEEIAAATSETGPDALVDLRVRSGPFGDQFGRRPDGLSLERLRQHPHGLDLGPLRSRLAEVVLTASGCIELAPAPVIADLARLEDALDDRIDGLVMVGRRHLRSKNSWLHNIPTLVSGRGRCTLQLHPDDAADRRLVDGAIACVSTSAGEVAVPVEITDAVSVGVCSLPHGWGHQIAGTGRAVAEAIPGVNSNVLADGLDLDPISGTAVLNGIPVSVRAQAEMMAAPTAS
jgi:anaerobic selenocysteine-containing dehydrogenase